MCMRTRSEVRKEPRKIRKDLGDSEDILRSHGSVLEAEGGSKGIGQASRSSIAVIREVTRIGDRYRVS